MKKLILIATICVTSFANAQGYTAGDALREAQRIQMQQQYGGNTMENEIERRRQSRGDAGLPLNMTPQQVLNITSHFRARGGFCANHAAQIENLMSNMGSASKHVRMAIMSAANNCL